MAYNPNNPYIPGDPYSYDLKWIICQLKKHGAELAGLDDRIKAIVISQLDQHDPIYFQTAADLISSGIRTEALAYIEGFHSAGDSGANLFYTTSDFNDVINAPFYLTLDGANRWALPIILSPYITPQMFGAYGDNTHDDTEALNKTFVGAFEYRKNVLIPAGDYKHSGLTIYGGAFQGDAFLPTVEGVSRTRSRLYYDGSGNAITISPYNNVNYIQGIDLKNIGVVNTENAACGIQIASGTRINLSGISVDSGAIGINSTSNMWISSFKDIYIGGCAKGINLTGGSNTSLYLDEIYVMNSTDTAYQINGSYSHIGILAADFCSGNYVYNFAGIIGTIDALGCEGCSAATLFRFARSRGNVGALHIINADWDQVQRVCQASDSALNVATIRTSSPSATTATAPVALLSGSTRFQIMDISGNVTLGAIEQAQAGMGSMATVGTVNVRTNTGRLYLGTDRRLSGTALLPDVYKKGVALFTDCTQQPRYLADGTDARWSTPVYKGDWFIEADPAEYMTAAYVVMEDNNSDASSIKYGRVPILRSGTTANRPTGTLPAGLMYFDTTLGKPVFFKSGTTWVDATGATV